jgi:nicotinate-nucleotide pyrophosphorylase (carboxylating)
MPASMGEDPIGPWLSEDRAEEDVTSRSLIPEGAEAEAEIRTNQPLVVAGLDTACRVLETDGVTVDPEVEDGQRVDAGELLAEAHGPAHPLLARERTALNVLAHLSGIATRTAEIVDRVDETDAECEVLATRKTTPGLREREHEAVRLGGGRPHRDDLAGSVLVKENHLAFVSVDEAVEAARSNAGDQTVIVEAETADEARAVARASADGVLLDNVDPEGLGDLVELLKRLEPSLTVEASGGITLDTVADYAPHVDRVSLGSLTHSAPAADVTMRVEPV